MIKYLPFIFCQDENQAPAWSWASNNRVDEKLIKKDRKEEKGKTDPEPRAQRGEPLASCSFSQFRLVFRAITTCSLSLRCINLYIPKAFIRRPSRFCQTIIDLISSNRAPPESHCIISIFANPYSYPYLLLLRTTSFNGDLLLLIESLDSNDQMSKKGEKQAGECRCVQTNQGKQIAQTMFAWRFDKYVVTDEIHCRPL